ncbi:PTS beta-glucoside transporter subunit IIBCA [Caniella muris]|uniref:PTS beta-glucoside transporter subunit IIBCA n=1 Tax=Caniella muris TaxID=2941502 RepID=UPI00203C91AA|nr:PTS transporter subunit IIBCA [Caniella muris]
MDYAKSAKDVLGLVGGASNVASAAHCATRLRLVIVDNAKVDRDAIEDVDGVKGVFEAQGQLQIIFGTGTVNKVYEEFVKAGGITGASKDEAKQAAAAKQNPVMRGIKLLGDVFVPIIPAIVASGLLLGIMSTVGFMASNGFIQLDTSNEFYVVADLVSSTAFTFLQVLIGFSAAKAFGANPFLGAVMGAIMIHPSLESAYNLAALSAAGEVPQQSMLFGLISVDWMGYQGHVVPIVIACAILAFLEKRLHKVVPEAVDLFVTPLVSVFVSAYLVLGFVGPVFVVLENAVLGAVQWLITLPFGLGALVVGGFYAPTVVTGLHQMYTAIDLGQLASYGVTYWLPIASAANIGQAAACLAVSVKTKSPKVRGLAFPAALSGFMGITEPAIFGVNLRFFKVFVAGCIGGAVGALLCSLTGLAAAGTGVTGIFGILLCLNMPLQYALMFAATAAVAFGLSFVLYSDEPAAAKADKAPAAEPEAAPALLAAETLVAPLAGSPVAAADIADPTFAAEILGPTVAIDPGEADRLPVVAPCGGTVSTVFDTGHAVGITSDSGAEILIHVGVDTVKMEGEGFSKLVSEGQRVVAGDPLLDVDFSAVRRAGYPATTMMIVSNAYDFDVERPELAAPVEPGKSDVMGLARKG